MGKDKKDNCCKWETDYAAHQNTVTCAQCGTRWHRKEGPFARWTQVHRPSAWSKNPTERAAAKAERDLRMDHPPANDVEAFRQRILKALLEGMTTEAHVTGIEKAIMIVQNIPTKKR